MATVTSKANLGQALSNVATNWVGDALPAAGDTWKIDTGTVMIVPVNTTCAAIDATGAGTLVVMNSNVKLTVGTTIIKGSYGVYEFNSATSITGKGIGGL
jgi:hypothetical protein